jgi:hypothetical protein
VDSIHHIQELNMLTQKTIRIQAAMVLLLGAFVLARPTPALASESEPGTCGVCTTNEVCPATNYMDSYCGTFCPGQVADYNCLWADESFSCSLGAYNRYWMCHA